MPNDSSTGGYLSPISTPAPLEDDALDDFLQTVLVGLTGISGTLVRPRWQPEPPNIPELTINWLAFGIMNQPSDTFAFEGHTSNITYPNGADVLQRNEELEILTSAYGPASRGTAALIRDGLGIAQNREALQLAGMNVISIGDQRSVPEQINNKWYRRIDMSVFIRREIIRVYPVLNLLSAAGTIKADTNPSLTVPFDTDNEP